MNLLFAKKAGSLPVNCRVQNLPFTLYKTLWSPYADDLDNDEECHTYQTVAFYKEDREYKAWHMPLTHLVIYRGVLHNELIEFEAYETKLNDTRNPLFLNEKEAFYYFTKFAIMRGFRPY